ncbi:MAG TPA: PEP-CTERM sorting domain-containing protein [Cellvibrio sp.]|nr:PEP-CTERM sorting domain-containing protein [Cellvibrio sp.]
MKHIKKIMAVGLVAGVFNSLAASAYAAPVMSFGNSGSDTAHAYQVGDTVSLDLWISGLDGTDDLGGLDIAGFDMNLSFNGGVTGYQNTLFSTDLDDSLFFGLTAMPTSGNSLNLSGLSLLWDLSSQASAFKLFTLSFSADQAGVSTLQLDDFILSNSWGEAFVSANYLAEITVTDKPVSVPEPGTLGLLFSALALVFLRRRSLK